MLSRYAANETLVPSFVNARTFPAKVKSWLSVLSKYPLKSIVLAPPLLVIVKSFPTNERSWISFVISKSASFTRFVKSTVIEFPFSISICNEFPVKVAPVRFWLSVPELFNDERSIT